MSTDLETDLRREFDSVRAPGNLTFSPDSVVRTGRRTIRRRRILAGGSAVAAVVLIAGGSTILTGPHKVATPLPATRTATVAPTTGIVSESLGFSYGTYVFSLNRDVSLRPNVKLTFETPDGQQHALGSLSTGLPGQKPDAIWKSSTVDGHLVTLGLVPGANQNVDVTFADGGSYGVATTGLEGTGFTLFVVDYTSLGTNGRQPARPPEIASIHWSGETGGVDGIAGDQRVTGRVLTLSKSHSVVVALRPARDGRTTVSGQARTKSDTGAAGTPLTVATTDPSGAAVVTGRTPVLRIASIKGVRAKEFIDGGPTAAGILPPGSLGLGVDLTTGESTTGLSVVERLPDGRLIFAITPDLGLSADPGKVSITAVTWTNADGTHGRIAVTQKQR